MALGVRHGRRTGPGVGRPATTASANIVSIVEIIILQIYVCSNINHYIISFVLSVEQCDELVDGSRGADRVHPGDQHDGEEQGCEVAGGHTPPIAW